MDAYLVTGGITSAALAAGHAGIGFRWVLPQLRSTRFAGTPFGRPSLTLGMLVFSWHVVTIMLAGVAALMLAMAGSPADPRTVVLLWLGGVFAAAAALALWRVRRRPQAMLRFPVPLLITLVAAMALAAS